MNPKRYWRLAALALPVFALAQTAPSQTPPKEFEVASIKPVIRMRAVSAS